VRAYYAQAGIDIDGLLRPYLRFADVVEYGGPHGAQLPDDDLNSDLFAKDEFLVRRLR
jgi:hypothetical protein